MELTRGINHIGLTVPDIESATQFFKEALNGKIAYDSQIEYLAILMPLGTLIQMKLLPS